MPVPAPRCRPGALLTAALLAATLSAAPTTASAMVVYIAPQAELAGTGLFQSLTRLELDVELIDTIEAVRSKINDRDATLAFDRLVLHRGSTLLDGGRTLADYNIMKEATLTVGLQPLSAVPEPATGLLLAAGIAAVFWKMARGRRV